MLAQFDFEIQWKKGSEKHHTYVLSVLVTVLTAVAYYQDYISSLHWGEENNLDIFLSTIISYRSTADIEDQIEDFFEPKYAEYDHILALQ